MWLKFDNKIGENDKIFEDNNVKLLLKRKFGLLGRNYIKIFRWFKRKRICFNNQNAQRTMWIMPMEGFLSINQKYTEQNTEVDLKVELENKEYEYGFYRLEFRNVSIWVK